MSNNNTNQPISDLHRQMIRNESLYQLALKNDSEFSVLKGIRDAMKKLAASVETISPDNGPSPWSIVPGDIRGMSAKRC
jgi:hypothetical protein